MILAVIIIGIGMQIFMQWYLDTLWPMWWRYKIATSFKVRLLNNMISSTIVAVLFGAATGLYAPIILIAANLAYELISRFLLHKVWIRDYKKSLEIEDIEKEKKRIRKEIAKDAKKRGITLFEDDLQKLTERVYNRSESKPVLDQEIRDNNAAKREFMASY